MNASSRSPNPSPNPSPHRQLRSQQLRRLGGGLAIALGGLLLGLLLLGLPLWVGVSCDRSPPSPLVNCQLRGSSLMGIPWRNQTLSNVAGVELNLQSYQPGRMYRTFLYTYEAEIPLASYSVVYATAQSARDKIKDFLENPEQSSLQVSYQPPWVTVVTALVFAILMLGLGGLMVWLG